MNIFKRIWAGELSLVTVFWIFGIAVVWLIDGLFIIFRESVSTDYSNIITPIEIAVFSVYQLLITVGVWRSANEYLKLNKSKWLWAFLAKLIVAIQLMYSVQSIQDLPKKAINNSHVAFVYLAKQQQE